MPIIAAIAVIALTCALGNWQLDRAHQRLARAAAAAAGEAAAPIVLNAAGDAPADADYHRIRARGRWQPELAVFLENRPHGAARKTSAVASPASASGPAAGQVPELDGRSGFEVVMPLALSGGGAVLVKRGWIPRDPADPTLVPQFATPQDEVQVEGLALAELGYVYALGGKDEAGRCVRQNLDVSAYAAELGGKGVKLLPFVIQQSSEAGDGLRRDWVRQGSGADRNYGYAFQWFALAAMMALFAVFHYWRGRNKRRDRQSDKQGTA
ncbi:MAG: SURF1 family protein [Candidatus Protistobacter heckmanni]|nr:SURF1 family protein [Candidatus Protistobacter heckmanni]